MQKVKNYDDARETAEREGAAFGLLVCEVGYLVGKVEELKKLGAVVVIYDYCR